MRNEIPVAFMADHRTSFFPHLKGPGSAPSGAGGVLYDGLSGWLKLSETPGRILWMVPWMAPVLCLGTAVFFSMSSSRAETPQSAVDRQIVVPEAWHTENALPWLNRFPGSKTVLQVFGAFALILTAGVWGIQWLRLTSKGPIRTSDDLPRLIEPGESVQLEYGGKMAASTDGRMAVIWSVKNLMTQRRDWLVNKETEIPACPETLSALRGDILLTRVQYDGPQNVIVTNLSAGPLLIQVWKAPEDALKLTKSLRSRYDPLVGLRKMADQERTILEAKIQERKAIEQNVRSAWRGKAGPG